MDTRALAEQFDPILQDMGMTCAGVEWLPASGHSTLRVYIERLDGEVDIDDCEAASHELSGLLDVEDIITVAYVLEVSSPGLDRPLFTLEQYQRFAGEKVKVVLAVPQDGRRRFTGTIETVEDDVISLLLDDGQSAQLDFHSIENARLVPDWDALGLAPVTKPSNKKGGKRKKRKKK